MPEISFKLQAHTLLHIDCKFTSTTLTLYLWFSSGIFETYVMR